MSSLKQQLEVYKIQAHELQNKVADEIKRADKAEFELKRGQEKMGALIREKEVSAVHNNTMSPAINYY